MDNEPLAASRFAAMARAIELQVDREDFAFESDVERRVWPELEEELRVLARRLGPTWLAEVA